MNRYIGLWAIVVLILLSAVAGLNAVIDPYGLIGSPRIAGLNKDKIAAVDWPRLTKPYLVARTDPATLLLGTSTTDVGFDPDSRDWPAARKPVFNLGIDGVSPGHMYRFEQHALAVAHPTLVIISVSLEDSLQFGDPSHGPEEFDGRLSINEAGAYNPDYRIGIARDYLFATLSLQALEDSARTVLRQRDALKTYQTPHGLLVGGEFAQWAKNDGFYALVADKDRLHARMELRWAHDPRFNIDKLEDMIVAARASGAQVAVVMIPAYVDQMEIRRQIKINDAYDVWKGKVVAITDSVNKQLGNVTLWDFSGFSPYTTEELPAPNDRRGRLRWFWESVHFQPELGNLIIQRLMGGGPSDFGATLTQETLAANITAYHAAQDKWVLEHPDDVARVSRFIAEANCSDHPEECRDGAPSVSVTAGKAP